MLSADIARMKPKAVPHAGLKARFLLVPLAAAAMLLAGFAESATAASPVGKDGSIHACYRVKGKPKGGLRVVPSAKTRCKRGERKVTWSAAGTSQAGSNGQAGSGGGSQPGQAGSNGSPGSNELALKTEVTSLSLKLAALEGVLEGIGKGDLSGMLGRVNGLESVLDGVNNAGLTHAVDAVKDVTGSDLLEAVDAAPLVEEVCAQTEALTGRSNALLGLLDTLDALNVLPLPATLPIFNVCPAP